MNKYKKYTSWREEGLLEEDGILVASDISQEWLLPWWWENYSKHNSYPVTFVDLGLSENKRKWCRERGELVFLPMFDFLIQDREEISANRAELWEDKYGDNFWQHRKAWFKKPLACLRSPYLRTIWLDLDCEVCSSLKPLFEFADLPSGIGIARDGVCFDSSFPIYNSGVIVFRRNLEILSEWAVHSLERNGDYRGDQDLLSQIIFERQFFVHELPSIYNWTVSHGKNDRPVVFHWVGDVGKDALRAQIALKDFI